SEDDIQEVRETLLSEAFLDERNHPRIVATAVDITGEPPLLNVGLNIRIKQTEKVFRVPIRVTVDEERFRAEGELYLLQSDFGVKVFSGYLGFISVKDTIQIRFDILGRTLE
ncbi:MAG: YceI family protein, partial [bacterium]